MSKVTRILDKAIKALDKEHKIDSYSLEGHAITITNDGKGYNLYIDGKYKDSSESADRLRDVARKLVKEK